MKATFTVPAGFVPYLRKGLFGEWGEANEQLANLSLQFGSGAPDGAYSSPLHTFFTVLMLLYEIGWHDNDAQGDVVVNLGIGGPHVVKGLKHESLALEDQLSEMPKRTRKAMRDAASAKVAEFGEFVKEVEEQVRRLNHQPVKSSTSHSSSRPPLRATPSRVRRSRH
jgi:hypothetical protein